MIEIDWDVVALSASISALCASVVTFIFTWKERRRVKKELRQADRDQEWQFQGESPYKYGRSKSIVQLDHGELLMPAHANKKTGESHD